MDMILNPPNLMFLILEHPTSSSVEYARGTFYSETSYAYYYDPTFGPFVLSSLRSSTFVFLFFSKHPHPLFSIGREGPYLLILFGFLSNSPHLK